MGYLRVLCFEVEDIDFCMFYAYGCFIVRDGGTTWEAVSRCIYIPGKKPRLGWSFGEFIEQVTMGPVLVHDRHGV